MQTAPTEEKKKKKKKHKSRSSSSKSSKSKKSGSDSRSKSDSSKSKSDSSGQKSYRKYKRDKKKKNKKVKIKTNFLNELTEDIDALRGDCNHKFNNLRRVQAKFNVDEFATEIMEIKHKIKRKHDKDIRDLEKNTSNITSQLKALKEETKNKISMFKLTNN